MSEPKSLRDIIAEDPRLAELIAQAQAHAAWEAVPASPKPWWRRCWEQLVRTAPK